MNQGIGSVQILPKPRRHKKVGHTTGTAAGQAYAGKALRTATWGQGPIIPRLFDLDTTAGYLRVSPWTVRALEAAGVLPRVRVPLPHGGELRKLLFDKADLDRLIGVWKDAPR